MRERKRLFNKLLVWVFALLVLIGGVFTTPSFSASAKNPYPFDEVNVLEDLESSKDFKLIDYGWDYSGLYRVASVMNFVEWCYSPFKSDDFALYVYFYNPANLKIDTDNYSNRIQIASEYTTYPITRDSVPKSYDTYNLVFCNMSMRENFEGMFYKFRVIDKKGADGMYIRERVYSGERRYDVSGLTLAMENGDVKEIGVGGTYYFTGYAAGYGPNANSTSTLKCTGFYPLETLSIKVTPTLYRQSANNELGNGHRWDINSVYFSVPEKYFTDYGALQKIKAEWWEYETEPIYVSTHEASVVAFNEYLGVDIGERNSALAYGFGDVEYTGEPLDTIIYYGYTYNIEPFDPFGRFENLGLDFKKPYKAVNPLYYAFHADSLINNTVVSSDKLSAYIKEYDRSAKKGYLPVLIDGQKISADLFKTGLSDDRVTVPYSGENVHHKTVEIDANDRFDILNYNPVADNVWAELWTAIFGRTLLSTMKDVSPIHANVSDYIDLSDSALAGRLMISPLKEDMDKFRNFYNSAKEKRERTVVFNFAQTDYYEEKQVVYQYAANNNSRVAVGQALVSTQTVFLDFKIIHLTFQTDGEYTTIPVTQNPINIINSVSSGAQHVNTDWENLMENFFATIGSWGVYILYAVVIVLVVYILIKIAPFIKKISGGKTWVFILLLAIVIAGCLLLLGLLGGYAYGIIANLG